MNVVEGRDRYYLYKVLLIIELELHSYAASTASVTTRHPHPPKRAAVDPAELDPCEPESGSITSASFDGVAEGSGCAVNGGGDGDGGGGDFGIATATDASASVTAALSLSASPMSASRVDDEAATVDSSPATPSTDAAWIAVRISGL